MTIETISSVNVELSSRQHLARPMAETDDSAWNGLFKVGGTGALIAAVVFRRNLDAEVMLLHTVGVINAGSTAAPGTVVDWFMLLQSNKLLGLTLLNLFDLVNYALVGLIFLALVVVLRRTSPSAMTIAAALAFVGIAVYLESNQALHAITERPVRGHDNRRAEVLAPGFRAGDACDP